LVVVVKFVLLIGTEILFINKDLRP